MTLGSKKVLSASHSLLQYILLLRDCYSFGELRI
jgi:hypothetical protein